MKTNEQSVTGPEGSSVPRRTIVQGAAWTVPIIATAVAAPMAAASTGPCPDISTSAGWSARNEGWPFAAIVPGDANQFVNNTTFSWTLGNQYGGNGVAPTADSVLSRTFNVKAGTKYTFTYNIYPSGNTNASSSPGWPASLTASIDGVQRVADTTRQTVPIADNVILGPYPRTFTYTAPATKAVTFDFRFIAYPRNGFPNQDNFAVTLPTITCAV